MGGFIVGEEEKPKAEPKESKPAQAAKKKPSAAAPSPSANLELPADLPDAVRKAILEAIQAFNSVWEAKSGQDKLLTKAIGQLKAASARAIASSS